MRRSQAAIERAERLRQKMEVMDVLDDLLHRFGGQMVIGCLGDLLATVEESAGNATPISRILQSLSEIEW